MSSEMNEAEMLERLRDGCGFASDACASICRSLMLSAPLDWRDYRTLLVMLRQASGAAGQLAHAQQNPAFLDIRNALESLRDSSGPALKMRSEASGLLFARMGDALRFASANAVLIACAKPVSRQDVLAALDHRVLTVH